MKFEVIVVCSYLFIIISISNALDYEREYKYPKKLPFKYKTIKNQTSAAAGESFWYNTIPLLPVVIATSKTIPDGECKAQLQRYLTDLQNGLYWATQMFDASEKYPYGVIDGSNKFLGNFDQCYRLNVQVPNGRQDDLMTIKGRYCLVDFQYERKNIVRTEFQGEYTFDFEPTGSVWESIEEKGDFRRNKRYKLQMALCVPAACSAEDVEKSLASVYDEFGTKNNLHVKASAKPRNCQTYDEEPELPNAACLFCAIVICVIALVIIGSVYDKNQDAEDAKSSPTKAKEFLLCFSVYRNAAGIFQMTHNHPALDGIHLMKFVITCFALIGHRVVLFCYVPLINKRYLEQTINMMRMIFVHNGTATVDVFFAISGLLTCYGCLEYLNKTKRFNIFLILTARLIRLFPAYALIIFFYATLFPHMGSGPFWKSNIIQESEYCSNNWWTNLLFINNYIKGNEMCIFQSWYLSADIQCFILAIITIYIFWRLPRKCGYFFFGLCIIGSIALAFYVTYVHKTQSSFMGRPYLNGILEDTYFVNYYITLHLHLPSYLVGVLSGAIIYDCNSVTWRLSKVWSNIVVLIPVFVCSLSLVLGYKYFDPNTKAAWVDIALYASIHRAIFSGGFCALIIFLQIGTGIEPYRKFLTCQWLQPLSRLSFGVFLTHGFIHLYGVGTMRTMQTIHLLSIFWNLIPDAFFSLIISFAIAVCIEGPCIRMKNVLMSKSMEETPDNKELTETNGESKKTK